MGWWINAMNETRHGCGLKVDSGREKRVTRRSLSATAHSDLVPLNSLEPIAY